MNDDDLKVAPGSHVQLDAIDPRHTAHLGNEEAARAGLAEDAEAINDLQDRLYAEGTRSLLIILQGMDTSGKDGTIRGVFNIVGPLGVTVSAFREPTPEELAHDFLWRAHIACPRRGTIGIFNRSYYEDVLIGRVRQLAPASAILHRYDDINAFEKMLTHNGTTILKFMLHISKEEQKERLQERLDTPDKNWKFRISDLDDRKRWQEFMEAYEIMLSNCSTDWAPWYVIPADRKWARNAAIARIVRATLEKMAPEYPKSDEHLASVKID